MIRKNAVQKRGENLFTSPPLWQQVISVRERINSGLAEARRKGVKLGRPEGTTLDREVFLQKHKDIVRHLKAGQSVRNTAKISAKGVSTVQRIKAAISVA